MQNEQMKNAFQILDLVTQVLLHTKTWDCSLSS